MLTEVWNELLLLLTLGNRLHLGSLHLAEGGGRLPSRHLLLKLLLLGRVAASVRLLHQAIEGLLALQVQLLELVHRVASEVALDHVDLNAVKLDHAVAEKECDAE